MRIYKKRSTFLLFFLIFMLYAGTAHADYGTHINVTITEEVFQETSFAENFTLTEWQKTCYSEGTVNITNPNTETIYDIYISFTNTDGLSTNFTHDSATKFGNQTTGAPGSIIVLNVPELRSGNYSVFTYNISCMGLDPPVNLMTNYTSIGHSMNRKVLAGYNWTVDQTVRNDNPISMDITNLNITIIAENVTWESNDFPFSLEELYAVGDYTNVSGNGTSSIKWWWTPRGGVLPWQQNESISFRVRAPYSVPFTATYLAIREVVNYEVSTLLSNLTIVDINATAQVDFDFEKRIVEPADNTESHNVTWEISPTISVPVNITYNLNAVTLWVTENLDITNTTENTNWGLLQNNMTGFPTQINMSVGWTGTPWYFNYTDGTDNSNPPPIVWMKPEHLIANQYGQIVNYSTSVAGNDIYLKYIYVIHGYWLEVSKNITNIGEDQYQIDILVENIGNGWTPNGTYVTVYDYVPQEFGMWDIQPAAYDCPGSACQTAAVGTAGAQFYGDSFRWNIQWKDGINASLGPKRGPDATGWTNYSWNVSYKVNGTGPYRVTDLYVVGLDPLKVDGAFTSPIITIISGIQTYSNEILYISVIAFLIIINITNLIMTNRIHNKIQSRLPPAPPAQHHMHQRPPMQ